MKTIRIIFTLGILLLFGCKENPVPEIIPDVPYVVEMQKINSEWISDTFYLPPQCSLFLYTKKGSYYLKAQIPKTEQHYTYSKTIRAGIIDFKIKN